MPNSTAQPRHTWGHQSFFLKPGPAAGSPPQAFSRALWLAGRSRPAALCQGAKRWLSHLELRRVTSIFLPHAVPLHCSTGPPQPSEPWLEGGACSTGHTSLGHEGECVLAADGGPCAQQLLLSFFKVKTPFQEEQPLYSLATKLEVGEFPTSYGKENLEMQDKLLLPPFFIFYFFYIQFKPAPKILPYKPFLRSWVILRATSSCKPRWVSRPQKPTWHGGRCALCPDHRRQRCHGPVRTGTSLTYPSCTVGYCQIRDSSSPEESENLCNWNKYRKEDTAWLSPVSILDLCTGEHYKPAALW